MWDAMAVSFGVLVLGWTACELSRGVATAGFLYFLDRFTEVPWDWLELDRDEHPLLFWIAIVVQAGLGLAFIVYGVIGFMHPGLSV